MTKRNNSFQRLRESPLPAESLRTAGWPTHFFRQCACMFLRLFARTALLALLLINISAEIAVIPSAYSLSPGEGAQNLPGAGQGEGRYQNVFSASELASLMPNGGLIRQVGLRLDETVRGTLTGHIPELEIRMGTTPSLTPVITLQFARNIGTDYHVVVPRRSMDYTVSGSANSSTPAAFTLLVPFDVPYLYDPRKGSLLVDLFMRGSTTTLYMDAHGSFGLHGPADLREGAYVPPLVMSLDFNPIPEPSAAVVCIVGLLLLASTKGKFSA